MANGAMQDYTRFLTDKSEKSEKSEKSTGKDKPAQDAGVKSNNQGVKFDNNAAGTSKANNKGTKKQHDPDIICLRCDEPGHIARFCTNKGKPAMTYSRAASQQGDKGGDKGSKGGAGKDGKKGSVSAAAAAGTSSMQEYQEFCEYQEFKAQRERDQKKDSTRRK
jgi:hypothetical protein